MYSAPFSLSNEDAPAFARKLGRLRPLNKNVPPTAVETALLCWCRYRCVTCSSPVYASLFNGKMVA
eukprot:608093-Prorocentrum_minimum.AAC.1